MKLTKSRNIFLNVWANTLIPHIIFKLNRISTINWKGAGEIYWEQYQVAERMLIDIHTGRITVPYLVMLLHQEVLILWQEKLLKDPPLIDSRYFYIKLARCIIANETTLLEMFQFNPNRKWSMKWKQYNLLFKTDYLGYPLRPFKLVDELDSTPLQDFYFKVSVTLEHS